MASPRRGRPLPWGGRGGQAAHNHPVPAHLRPTGAVAGDALLTGDPKRAMDIAAALLPKPLMSNLSRGLWGYHGATPEGHELTVQSAGIGAPSAAVVLEELAELGVRRVVRIGTARALAGEIAAGDQLVVERAIGFDGVSAALGGGEPAEPDGPLTRSLLEIADARGAAVATTDLHYDPRHESRRIEWAGEGASAVDLSTAAILTLGKRLGLAVACLLVVTESAAGESCPEDRLDERCLEAATAAAHALATAQSPARESSTPRLP